MTHKIVKTTLTVCAALFVTNCASGTNVAKMDDNQKYAAASMATYSEPVFPLEAAKRCEAGAVLLEYDVAFDGRVKADSIRVLADAGSPALAKAATNAVSQWAYAPMQANGARYERTNQRTTINFEIEGCTPSRVE